MSGTRLLSCHHFVVTLPGPCRGRTLGEVLAHDPDQVDAIADAAKRGPCPMLLARAIRSAVMMRQLQLARGVRVVCRQPRRPERFATA